MKALRVTLLSFLVSALLLSGCNRRAAAPNANANGGATPAGGEQSSSEPSGDARALYEEGLAAYKADRDQEAVEKLKRAVELSPDFPEANYRLGLAYNATKQREEADKAFEGAVKAYEKVTKREPKNSDAYYFLGLSYEQLGKYDEAVKALKEAVKNSPEENDDKYFELANAHFKIAQYDEAVRALNKVLEINPDNYPAQELLEQARNGAQRVSEFRKHQEELLKRKNTNSNANNSKSNANAGPRVTDNLGPPPT
ncbi:MAG: tetratricopeptide repeat protein [Acidobacteria bacterium]|nr:tetratricopeptide repeat protein [Acidobacteriota bacterium]